MRTDEQLALQASIREWAKRAAVIDVARGLEPGTGGHHGVATARGDGPAAERWAGLAELGVFGIGLPAAAANQILLSVVAERQLGLPREEVR